MNTYKKEVAEALSSHAGIPAEEILPLIAEPPPEIEGDLSVPCFSFARVLKKSPTLIAENLAREMKLPVTYHKVTAVNGYLNFCLDPEAFARQTLSLIQEQGKNYGDSVRGKGKVVTIDFSSPNMGKELAFHHLRGTMLGNALSKLYVKCGYRVVRINHLGDWGTSYGKLIFMYLREGLPVDEKSLSGLSIEKLNELYQSFARASKSDPGLDDEARRIFRKLESGDEKIHRMWKAFRHITLNELKKVYATLGVEFDNYTGESFFARQAEAILQDLKSKNLLTISQGSEIVDLSQYDLPPLMLKKSDGSTLYATRDLCAALYRKEEYGFHRNLYVVDNGQALHFQQFFKVLELMGHDWQKECEHVPFGLILTRSEDGTWEKGKTRLGGVSLLKDVIQRGTDKILKIIIEKNPGLKNREFAAGKIAVGALVFNGLKHKRQNDVNFEWDSVLSFEGDTGPYAVNAYVRLASILRKGRERKNLPQAIELDFNRLREAEARDLIKGLSRFSEKVENALNKNEPSVLAQYVLSLAEKAHRFMHTCRVLSSPEERERLLLVDCTRIVLRNTLELIGIPLVEEM
ncbi:arginine--tRNA ligase [Fibrobacterota bacterium]